MTDKSNWTMAERREKALRDGYDQIAHHAHQIGLIIKRGSLAAFEDEPTAPSPAQAGVEAVAVKALEWSLSRAVPDDPENGHYGFWVGGWYLVKREKRGMWSAGTHHVWAPGNPSSGQWRSLGTFTSKDEAKAAAQADYAARIRSALTPAPTPVEAGGERGD